MHGIVEPETDYRTQRESLRARLGSFVRQNRWFLGLVVLPTAILTLYLYAFASDQYEARADFIVRQADSREIGGNFGQLLGMSFGVSATTSEAYLVSDYLLSHETVERLRKEDRLVERFRRPQIDLVSRLWSAAPTPEKLLEYFRRQARIIQDPDTGISHLTVRAFTPKDAYSITRKMLSLGEERINQLNERTYNDQVANSRRELQKAEEGMLRAERAMTAFRRIKGDINPEGTGKAQTELVTQLEGRLALARSKLAQMDGVISPDSPQYKAMRAQVQSLQAQISNQSRKLAGGEGSIASSLGDYERLAVRQESATRLYGVAVAQFEKAKADAQRQQVYLVRVVDVNMPVKSLYPERLKLVFTMLLALTFAYAIGWMIISGLREHHI